MAVYAALAPPNITAGRVGRGNAGFPRPKGRGSGIGLCRILDMNCRELVFARHLGE